MYFCSFNRCGLIGYTSCMWNVTDPIQCPILFHSFQLQFVTVLDYFTWEKVTFWLKSMQTFSFLLPTMYKLRWEDVRQLGKAVDGLWYTSPFQFIAFKFSWETYGELLCRYYIFPSFLKTCIESFNVTHNRLLISKLTYSITEFNHIWKYPS